MRVLPGSSLAGETQQCQQIKLKPPLHRIRAAIYGPVQHSCTPWDCDWPSRAVPSEQIIILHDSYVTSHCVGVEWRQASDRIEPTLHIVLSHWEKSKRNLLDVLLKVVPKWNHDFYDCIFIVLVIEKCLVKCVRFSKHLEQRKVREKKKHLKKHFNCFWK